VSVLSQDDVLTIVRIIEGSKCDELRLETEGLKLVVTRKVGGVTQIQPATRTPTATAPAMAIAAHGVSAAEKKNAPPSPRDDLVGKNLIPIAAPMLGTFYRSPKPGAPPFVEVGDVVDDEQVLCIVEVMKLFNSVKSSIRGRIVKVCAEDATLVEFGEPLFFVEPEAPTPAS